jgi:molybdate transport system ATP-binding protein
MISVDVAHRAGSFALEAAFDGTAGITALFGRSGSGKTTLIHLIAGLIRPLRGRIVLDGTTLLDTADGVFVPPHRRRVTLVHQDAQLFPHLTVRQNLLYGRFFRRRIPSPVTLEQVVSTLGIGALMDRRPHSLSGGEKQRVAIGRALLASPRLLLMDEPLASLDVPRKLEILPLIERLNASFGIPIVYVSHTVEEIARLADRVVLLDAGHVRAVGAPGDILGPVPGALAGDRFAAVSILTATVGDYRAEYDLTTLRHPAGPILLSGKHGPDGRQIRVVVRATDVALATQRPRSLSIRTVLEGTIESMDEANGPVVGVGVALDGGGRLLAAVTRLAIDDLGLGPGDRVHALIKTVALDERPVGGK